MHKRHFLKISLLLGAAGLGACDKRAEDGSMAARTSPPEAADLPEIPEFSPERFCLSLGRLELSFEEKGHHVAPGLLPPLTEHELREQCAWFPGELPPELVALYGWHAGQEKDPWEEEYPFWFRDYAFSNISLAEQEYRSMMESYGEIAEEELDQHEFELLKYAFPFAAFNGGWLVLPTKPQTVDGRLERPVISVFQEVDVFFYSMQIMVDTCIEWVSSPEWKSDGHFDDGVELEIWQKHNPGIFGSPV